MEIKTSKDETISSQVQKLSHSGLIVEASSILVHKY